MPETETVEGAVGALGESVEEFWAILEADTLDQDSKAEITQLMEGASDNLDAIKKILHDLREGE